MKTKIKICSKCGEEKVCLKIDVTSEYYLYMQPIFYRVYEYVCKACFQYEQSLRRENHEKNIIEEKMRFDLYKKERDKFLNEIHGEESLWVK